MLIVLAAAPCLGQQATWFLLSHEEGCVDLRTLVEAQKLPRVPTSPEDYAQMMRERGKEMILELPKDVPVDFKGKIVQVRISGDDGGPVFATDEVCRNLSRSAGHR